MMNAGACLYVLALEITSQFDNLTGRPFSLRSIVLKFK